MTTLNAVLQDDAALSAYLEVSQNIEAALSEVVIVETDPYTGTYIVEPRVQGSITLPTNNKRMTDNVTVLKVPYSEVSNPAGGKTVTIGGE